MSSFLGELIYGSSNLAEGEPPSGDDDDDDYELPPLESFQYSVNNDDAAAAATTTTKLDDHEYEGGISNHVTSLMEGLEEGFESANGSVVDRDKSETIAASVDAIYAPHKSLTEIAAEEEEEDDTDDEKDPFRNPLLFTGHKYRRDYSHETPKQAELRILRKKRTMERGYAKKRWSNRNVNLTEEEDVGNALAHRAHTNRRDRKRLKAEEDTVMEEEQEMETTTTTSSNEPTLAGTKRKRPEESDADPEEIVDSSDEEQDQVFQRLSQNQPLLDQEEEEPPEILSKENMLAKRMEEKIKQLRTSEFEILDYWKLGITAPKKDNLQPWARLDTALSRKEILKRKSTVSKENLRPKGIILGREYDEGHGNLAPDPNAFLQFPLNHYGPGDHAFFHHRNIIRLGTRYVVGTAGKLWREGLEDHLLRSMWEVPRVEQNQRLYFLLNHTTQMGVNMELFLTHSWKDGASRKSAAKLLGAADQPDHNDLLGPFHLVGRPLFPINLRRFYERDRCRAVANYSTDPKQVGTSKKSSAIKGNTKSAVGAIENETNDGGGQAEQYLIHPTVSYIHIPGTSPPVPIFPLDDTGLVFGPRDKHISFRQIGPIDETTYSVTVSSLLSRISAAMAGSSRSNYDEGYLQSLQEQLHTLVESSPSAASPDIHKYLQSYNRELPSYEMPLVQYYRTVMSFFSFASNGFLQFKKPDDQDDSSSEPEESVGVFEALKEDSVSMDKVANKIFDFCESHLSHDGLQAFPRLFLVHGLVHIAKMLPPPAAEILSRSFDGWKHRTPFDILRMLVEHLEDENMLVIDDDSPFTTTDIGNVQLPELDHALHQASSLFSKCIERDPLDIQYYGWHLGTLAASLLLSSGNRIGSKAYPFPSEPYTAPTDGEEIDMFGIFSGESRVTEQMVEHPRRTLPKFEEVRQSVQKALKLMVHLYQRQGGSILGNLYISSFLEWDQVIALLAGSNLQEAERLQELRSVHHHHAVQWAISEKSTKALEYLRLLRKSEDLASETKISQYASAIENEPDNVDHWRRLAAVLGPIGFKIPEEEGCAGMDCKDCKMLKEGLNIDHVNLDARKASGEWWGSDRVSWWYSHFLTLPYQYAYARLKSSDMKKVISVVDDKLKQLDPIPSEHEFSSNTVVPSTSSSIEDIAWLYDESEVDPSEYAAIYLPDNSLPTSFVNVLENDGLGVVVDDLDDLSESGTASEAEIVYLKLIVTCHLFGLNHVGLVRGICKMAQKCVDSACKIKEDCDEWHYFQKLCSMGLDVSKYLSLWSEL